MITDDLLDHLYREATIVRGKGAAFEAMRAVLEPIETAIKDLELRIEMLENDILEQGEYE